MLKILSHSNDEELFKLIKENNSKAFKQLFEKYYSRLCHFSHRYVKSTDLSKEVVSEVFVNIWLNRDKLNINTSLKSYLYKATRNRSINYVIKEQKYWENLDINDFENNLTTNNSPNDILDLKELEKIVESIVKKLPPRRQLVFRLNRIDGLTNKEIAELLSISTNTVQNHMIKAMEYIISQYPKIQSLFIICFYIIIF